MAADFEQVKQNIADTIYENGEELITGQVMQDRLLEMVSVTEEAINDVTIDPTVNVTVNNTTGTTSGSASFQNNQFSFEFSGIKGETGKSAYQIWLDAGHQGTEADFLASLQGNPGSSQDYPFELENSFNGGTSKALTAEKGKELYEMFGGVSEVEIDLSSVTQIQVNIDSQSPYKWVSINAVYSKIVQLSGTAVKLVNNGSRAAIYAILSSDAHVVNTIPDFVTGYESRMTLAAGNEVSISNIPAGSFVCVRADTNNVSIPKIIDIIPGTNRVLRVADTVDNLRTDNPHLPLSASQGYKLANDPINMDRVYDLGAESIFTIGGYPTGQTWLVQNNDFRCPLYPAVGYHIVKLYIHMQNAATVDVGIYSASEGITGLRQISVAAGLNRIDVDIEIPAGSYIGIGNATGLIASSANIYGVLNVTQGARGDADIAFWFDSENEGTPIKQYISDQINQAIIPPGMVQIFPKLTTVGDSLMAGYTRIEDVLVNSAQARAAGNNWPTYLAKRYGLDVNNLAIGSSTAENWRYANGPSADNLADISDANIPTDCYLIGIGVNDARTGTTVGSTTDIKTNSVDNENSFYGNYDYIVRSMMAYNPKAHVFVFTIPKSESNIASYNEAIKHIANLYNSRVHVLDLEDQSEYTDGIIAACFSNGHYNPLAYLRMSYIIDKMLTDFIENNYPLFLTAPY